MTPLEDHHDPDISFSQSPYAIFQKGIKHVKKLCDVADDNNEIIER